MLAHLRTYPTGFYYSNSVWESQTHKLCLNFGWEIMVRPWPDQPDRFRCLWCGCPIVVAQWQSTGVSSQEVLVTACHRGYERPETKLVLQEAGLHLPKGEGILPLSNSWSPSLCLASPKAWEVDFSCLQNDILYIGSLFTQRIHICYT